jgi:hypothetical protein
VVSRTLKSVGPNARLVEGDLESAIRELKAERHGEIEVAGWAGLQTLVAPRKEILLLGESTADVLQILQGMSEDNRRKIAAAARARVLLEHTADHRARQLEGYYQEAKARTISRNAVAVA